MSKIRRVLALLTVSFVGKTGAVESCSLGSYKSTIVHRDDTVETSCELCPTGRYSDQPDATDCTTCPLGRTSVLGSASAEACCLAGNIGNQSSCSLCDAGRYDHDANAASLCNICPADTYQDQRGAVDCTTCPSGRASLPQAVSLDSCCPHGTQTEPPPDSYAYVGCFVDNTGGVRDLVSHPKAAKQLAQPWMFLQEEEPYTKARVTLCANACESEGWAYMGLQWQAECYCGNSYGSQGERDILFCDSTGDVYDEAGTDGLVGVADSCGMGVATCGNTNAVYALGQAPKVAVKCSPCVDPYYDLDQLASTPCAPCRGATSTYYGRAIVHM
jgi:hypothetical protein